MSKFVGRIKELAGWLTADRRAEAEGIVEQEVADPANPIDEETESVVEEETDLVRERYGELIEPSAEKDATSD